MSTEKKDDDEEAGEDGIAEVVPVEDAGKVEVEEEPQPEEPPIEEVQVSTSS